MPLAGATVTAGKLPGEQVGYDIETSNSSGITTTETTVQTVVAPVVAGRVYLIKWFADVKSTVAGDQLFVKIREDNASGTVLDFRRYRANANVNFPYRTEAEYTADATEDKTFVVTLVRESGTGTVSMAAAATSPAYLRAEYLRDA
jgi:hypothetical protein